MHDTQTFLLGLAITVALSFTVVWYLKSSLEDILQDLCGTDRRAQFWMAFTNVTLLLVPTVFAMQFHSAAEENVSAVFGISYQLKWSFVGLVTSVMAIGLTVSLFIRWDAASVRSK